MDHCDPKLSMVCMEGHKNAFLCKCVPSNEADIAGDSSSENCGIGDKIESCGENTSNSITCDDASHPLQGVEGGDDVYMLAVAATVRVLPEERCARLLVKNLGRGMPESVVREELEALGIHVQGVTQLRSGCRDQDPNKNRPPPPLYCFSGSRA